MPPTRDRDDAVRIGLVHSRRTLLDGDDVGLGARVEQARLVLEGLFQ